MARDEKRHEGHTEIDDVPENDPERWSPPQQLRDDQDSHFACDNETDNRALRLPVMRVEIRMRLDVVRKDERSGEIIDTGKQDAHEQGRPKAGQEVAKLERVPPK